MDINKIKELAEVYLQEQVDLLMRFTSVDSESNYVEGNRQVIDMARAVLETIPGVTMEEMFFEGCGTHLIARIKPEHPEGKIILNSHMDTVFPVGYAAKFPPYVDEDNWLHGLGSGDCKAGFAVSAYAVKIASELGLLPNKEIVMLYSFHYQPQGLRERSTWYRMCLHLRERCQNRQRLRCCQPA